MLPPESANIKCHCAVPKNSVQYITSLTEPIPSLHKRVNIESHWLANLISHFLPRTSVEELPFPLELPN